MRINKYLARCGACSRRDADKLISSGIVTVNGAPAAIGMDISEGDVVKLGDEVLTLPHEHLVLAYYKPVGVTCTERDVHAERTVTREIVTDRRLTYAGRLDRESEGLLIMTDDGELINAMMRGRNAHEKEYEVEVNKPLEQKALDSMSAGVFIKELGVKTRPCRIKTTGKCSFNIVLTQGINRQIRRMCSEYGYKVVGLKRTRVMNVMLGDLQVGASRKLTEKELSQLYKSCGLCRNQT